MNMDMDNTRKSRKRVRNQSPHDNTDTNIIRVISDVDQLQINELQHSQVRNNIEETLKTVCTILDLDFDQFNLQATIRSAKKLLSKCTHKKIFLVHSYLDLPLKLVLQGYKSWYIYMTNVKNGNYIICLDMLGWDNFTNWTTHKMDRYSKPFETWLWNKMDLTLLIAKSRVSRYLFDLIQDVTIENLDAFIYFVRESWAQLSHVNDYETWIEQEGKKMPGNANAFVNSDDYLQLWHQMWTDSNDTKHKGFCRWQEFI